MSKISITFSRAIFADYSFPGAQMKTLIPGLNIHIRNMPRIEMNDLLTLSSHRLATSVQFSYELL
jgi:hypothetical protein